MAYIAPSTRSAGALITATIWNQDVVANPIALNAGAFALSDQAAMDDMYASSSTQWAVGRRQLRQTFRGLTLRTHPDADVAAYKVYLDHADEIVMHDGTSVNSAIEIAAGRSGWDDLVADITVAGAGGLDTGTEQVSTWYEIHAIRKSSDGAKSLLLHRAKDYFLDEQNTTSTTTSALRDGAGQTKRAQTFDVDVTGPCERVQFKLTKVGTPTGQMWISIYATTGGLPTGAALKTSFKLDVSLIATSAQVVEFNFYDPSTLTAGTTYAAVLEGNFTISGSNYVAFDRSTTDPYAAGQLCAYDGATWTGSAVDAWFKIYITQNDTAVTMPSGYDQRAHIGWVWNRSTSDFSPMFAIDRHVFTYSVTVSGGTATIPTHVDTTAAHPPIPVMMTMAGLRQDAAGGADAFYFQPTLKSFGDGFGSYWGSISTGVFRDFGVLIPINFQHAYYRTAAGSASFFYPNGYEW